MQSITTHHALGKRIPMLDQFGRGLNVMGLLDVVQSFPEKCKQIFVQTSEEVGVTSVKEAMVIFSVKDETEEKLKLLLEKFIAESSKEGCCTKCHSKGVQLKIIKPMLCD